MSLNDTVDHRCFSGDPLEVVAQKLNAKWKESDDQRTEVALLLKEAKERVEYGEDKRFSSFREWCHELLPGRSFRDIRRLLQRANAPDPAEEGERQRRVARESMARTRARRKEDQRWSATEANETVFTRVPGRNDGAVQLSGPRFQPNGVDSGTDFQEELERCVVFFEQNADHIAQLSPTSIAQIIQRLQDALDVMLEAVA